MKFNAMEYLTDTVLELMTKYDIRIETNYIVDLNILEVYIDDKATGKNKICIDGADCCDEAFRLGKPQIEIAMFKLSEYLENMYGKKEPEIKIVANFSCPNCGASIETGSKNCSYCGTHFSYIGG